MIPSSNHLGLLMICLDVTLLFLGVVALGIRLKSRYILKQRLGLNDYSALLAWPLAAGHVAIVALAVTYGVGRHIHEVRATDLVKVLKCFQTLEVTWIASNTAIRVSTLCFYLTLFHTNRSFRVATFVLTGLALCFGLGALFTTFLICPLLFKASISATQHATCGSLIDSAVATGLINAVIDLGIILLPLPIIWKLQRPKAKKITLTLMFSLGLVVSAITVARIAISSRITPDDLTYHLAKLALVTDLEPLLGIIVACAPLFPATFKTTAHKRRRRPQQLDVFPNGPEEPTSKGAPGLQLQSFDDTYPLADRHGGISHTSIISASSRPSPCHWDTEADQDNVKHQQPAITVKRSWEVQTSSTC